MTARQKIAEMTANTTLLASFAGWLAAEYGREQALAAARREREARGGEAPISVFKLGHRYEVRLWNA